MSWNPNDKPANLIAKTQDSLVKKYLVASADLAVDALKWVNMPYKDPHTSYLLP